MTMMKTLARVALRTAAASAAVLAFSANASVAVLDFSGLQSGEAVLDYYNGGTGGAGSSGGPNYGISFGSDSIACTDAAHSGCNTSEIPGGPDAKIVYFLSGPGDVMNVAAGFNSGFSFFYSAIAYTGTVTVYDGLNGTGNVLATLNLGLTPIAGDPGCAGQYCPFEAAGVTFAGTARSVNFSGVADYIAFADITVGSSDAGGGTSPVPEPANIGLMMAGLAMVAGVARRRTR